MGLLSTIGGIVGGAIGTAFGNPVAGAAIGKGLGKAGESALKKKSKGGSSQAAAPSTPELKMYKSEKLELQGDVKVAQTAGLPGQLEDPWEPTRTWYKDLGGDASIDDYDFERHI